MIRYLEDGEKQKSRALYEEAFHEDSPSFTEYYYREKTKDNRILVYEKEGEIAAMAHLNPYRVKLLDREYRLDYVVAVATGLAYRRQGLMRQLIERFLRDMHEEGKPCTFLLPADRAYYEPFGFVFVNHYTERCFKENAAGLAERDYVPEDKSALIALTNLYLLSNYDVYCIRDAEGFERYLKELESEKGYIKVYEHNAQPVAYRSFWGIEESRERDFICLDEYAFTRTGDKPAYMFRIVRLKEFMKNIRLKPDSLRSIESFKIRIRDDMIPENNGTFLWNISRYESYLEKLEKEESLEVPEFDIGELASWLFGYVKKEGEEFYTQVQTIRSVFLNEVV